MSARYRGVWATGMCIVTLLTWSGCERPTEIVQSDGLTAKRCEPNAACTINVPPVTLIVPAGALIRA